MSIIRIHDTVQRCPKYGMMSGTADELEALYTEVAVLRGENAGLKAEVARLMAALHEALARIAELEDQPDAQRAA